AGGDRRRPRLDAAAGRVATGAAVAYRAVGRPFADVDGDVDAAVGERHEDRAGAAGAGRGAGRGHRFGGAGGLAGGPGGRGARGGRGGGRRRGAVSRGREGLDAGVVPDRRRRRRVGAFLGGGPAAQLHRLPGGGGAGVAEHLVGEVGAAFGAVVAERRLGRG